MATVLRIRYEPDKTPEQLARETLDKSGDNELVTIQDPEVMRLIEKINREEYECKLLVEVGEKTSYRVEFEPWLKEKLQ